MAIKYNLDHKEIQKRLAGYLENKEWTNQLDNFKPGYPSDENLFALTNLHDWYWLKQLLEEEGMGSAEIDEVGFDREPELVITTKSSLIDVDDDYFKLNGPYLNDTKKELIQLIHYTNHLDYIADVCSDWEKLYKFDNAQIYETFDISVHVFISSNGIDFEKDQKDLNNYRINIELSEDRSDYLAIINVTDTSAFVKTGDKYKLNLNKLSTSIKSFFKSIYYNFIK